MLSGYTLLSSVLLLTLAGLEIDLSVVIRRRREAAFTSLAGVVLPMALGVALGLVLPDTYLVDPARRLLFALFLGTALSISAMPVIAKTLLDLGFYRTDLGLLVMAAAMLDDVLGWLLFSLLVGPMHGAAAGWSGFAARIGGLAVFVTATLGLGRPLFDRILGRLETHRMTAAGRVLSMLFVVAFLGAAATQRMGIHAVFGAFIVGVAIGDSPRLRAETRSMVHEFVSNVFAPVFFAAVGLRVDFFGAFDAFLVAAVLVVACIAKVVGCSVGARLSGLSWRAAASVGFAMNSRGAMEIILALVALEAGLIRPQLFVALVVMALVTSLLAGPMMTRLLLKDARPSARRLVEEGAVVQALRARTAEQAARELAQELAAGTPMDGAVLADLVLDADVGSLAGLSDGVALAHARIEGIARPMLALGRSEDGIDFNAVDGIHATLVFLLIVPRKEGERAVELHAAIVAAVDTAAKRARVMAARSRAEILDALAG